MPTVQLDPSLIGGGGNAFVTAYQNALANSMKNQQNQQDYDLNNLKIQEHQSGVQKTNALNAIYQGAGGDSAKILSGLNNAGYGGEAQAYQKNLNEGNYKNADTRKTDLNNHFKKLELIGQLMGGVTDQASYDQMRAQAAKIPELADVAPNIPPQYDPRAIEIGRAKAMSVKDRLAAEHAQIVATETGRHNLAGENETRANNIDQTRDRGLTREQADAHYRTTREDSLNAPRGVQVQTDNGPVFADPRTGRSIPITGTNGQPLPAVEKPLNDSQAKALGFGERMRQSDKIINSLATEGTKPNVPGMDAPFIGGAVTAMSSGNQQMLKQAKTDFMTALLRRESGAAISSGEFTTADKQYFPQVGDSDGVIAQKAANRQLALTGVLQEVPSKQRDSIRPQKATSSQDSAAMAWAKSNPSDPRAAKILQHLGQ